MIRLMPEGNLHTNMDMTDFDMAKQWKSYQKKFPYATDLSWEVVMESVRDIYKRTQA